MRQVLALLSGSCQLPYRPAPTRVSSLSNLFRQSFYHPALMWFYTCSQIEVTPLDPNYASWTFRQ
jgi:hypothetical protein